VGLIQCDLIETLKCCFYQNQNDYVNLSVNPNTSYIWPKLLCIY